MKVEHVMTRSVSSCGPDETLNEAVRVMWEHDCGFVPVVRSEGSGQLVGVVTDRDACMAAYTRGQALAQIPIREVMSSGVRSCKPGADLAEAEEIMRGAQIHRLPVVDAEDRLVGVISLADIAREARTSGTSKQGVTAMEIGETVAAIRKPRVAPSAIG